MLALVFEIPRSGWPHSVYYRISPRAGSVYAVGRERGCLPRCGLRSISGVSGENRLPCSTGGGGVASNTVAVFIEWGPMAWPRVWNCAPAAPRSQLSIRSFLRCALLWRLKTLARAGRTERRCWKRPGGTIARTVCSGPAWRKDTGRRYRTRRWSGGRFGHSVAFHVTQSAPTGRSE